MVKRQEVFASILTRLDGTGAQVETLVGELFEHIDETAVLLLKVQVNELSAIEERVALTGERGSGRKVLQDRHKCQLRKFKTDKLRSGLTTVAGAYHALVVTQIVSNFRKIANPYLKSIKSLSPNILPVLFSLPMPKHLMIRLNDPSPI